MEIRIAIILATGVCTHFDLYQLIDQESDVPDFLRKKPGRSPGGCSRAASWYSMGYADNRQKGSGKFATPRPVKDLFCGIGNLR